MTGVWLRIMVRACKLRVAAGEALADVLASYPGLSAADKEQIREVMVA